MAAWQTKRWKKWTVTLKHPHITSVQLPREGEEALLEWFDNSTKYDKPVVKALESLDSGNFLWRSNARYSNMIPRWVTGAYY